MKLINQQSSSSQILAKIFSKNYSVERKVNSRLIFQDNKVTKVTHDLSLNGFKQRTKSKSPVKLINHKLSIGVSKGRF
jgi:hypothetical protein